LKSTQISWKKTQKNERPEEKKKRQKKNPFDSLLTYGWEVKTNVGYLPCWLEEFELEVLILVSKN
jgi:hypothetical protein